MPFTVVVRDLGRGLLLNAPPDVVGGGFVVSDNCILFENKVVHAPGFRKFTESMVGAGETIMAVDEFPLETGINHLLVFTDKNIYKYNAGTGAWEVVSKLGGYTGGLDDHWGVTFSFNTSLSQLWIFATNGRDPVQKWDGLSARFSDLGGGPHISADVADYQSLLVHLNVTEGGTERPRKVKWSDAGLPETYTGGLSGFLTLFQGASHGVALEPLGNYLVAYRERAIHLLSFVGPPFVLAQRQVVDGVGLVGRRAILNLDNKHIFLSNDNIYIFNGVDLEDVGSEIREELFNTIDPKYVARSLIALDESRLEMFLVVPTPGSGGVPDTWWVWNLVTGAWSGPIRGRRVMGMGPWERQQADIWDGDTQAWDEDTQIWNSAVFLEAFPTVLFGRDDRFVYELNYADVSASGTAVTARFETPTITPPQGVVEATALEIRPRFSGGSVVRWYIGTSSVPGGPFVFKGPFTVGRRGVVAVTPTAGRYFRVAAESESAFEIAGLEVEFEVAVGRLGEAA